MRLSTVTTAMPRSFARDIMRPRALSPVPRATNSLSMDLPALIASLTALRPSIKSILSFLRSASMTASVLSIVIQIRLYHNAAKE